MEWNFWVWFLIWAWDIFLTAWHFFVFLRQVVPMKRILSCSGHCRTLNMWFQDTSNLQRYTFSWTSCRQAWKTAPTLAGNTVHNNFHMGRVWGSSNDLGTLKSVLRSPPLNTKNSTYFTSSAQAWNNKITLSHNISNQAKYSKCSCTPGTQKSCTQRAVKVKHIGLALGTVQSLVKL